MWPYLGRVWLQVGEPLGDFGTREAQVLFASETGNTAVPERDPATQPLQPVCTVLAGVGSMDCPSPGSLVLCGPWHAGHAFTTSQAVHPRRGPLITPLFQLLPRESGARGLPSLPSPSLPPPQPCEALLCSPVYVEPVWCEAFQWWMPPPGIVAVSLRHDAAAQKCKASFLVYCGKFSIQLRKFYHISHSVTVSYISNILQSVQQLFFSLILLQIFPT